MREYTEEFYKVNLREGYIEDTSEKTAKYINGLRMDIQEEMSMLSPSTMEEVYQYALRAEEKISRKHAFGRGKGATKGRGQITGRGKSPVYKDEASGFNQQDQARKGHEPRGRRPYQRGRGRGRGRESVYQCYTCNKLGHRSYECPDNDNTGQRGNYVAEGEQTEIQAPEVNNVPEVGENLLMNKVLLKPEKEVIKFSQRKVLFRTACKVQGKCCKVVIDNGSTDNLVSIEMVEKLNLKKAKHPTPYKVSWLHKGHQMLVTEQSEVDFRIGSYRDKVNCDHHHAYGCVSCVAWKIVAV